MKTLATKRERCAATGNIYKQLRRILVLLGAKISYGPGLSRSHSRVRLNLAASESPIFAPSQFLYATQLSADWRLRLTPRHTSEQGVLKEDAAPAPEDVFASAPKTLRAGARSAPPGLRVPPALLSSTVAQHCGPVASRKTRLALWQMPPPLRDASTVRVSHLVNPQRVSRLISQSIDKGSSGKIRVALDRKSRAWAIKCFRTQALPEKTGLNAQGCSFRSNWPRHRIFQEIDMMRQASADIKVKEVIEAHDKIYVIHTLGDSSIGSLFHKVPQNLRVDAVHCVMWRMAQKLHDMHMRGYVHGDVKVHNALIRSGSMILCDFGATQPMAADGLVQPVLCSTFPPPEQALGQRFGPPADVWGLGATIMDMLCLHSHNALVHAHTFDDTAERLRDFAVWRHGLLDIYGWFHPKRLLRDTSKWGAFFAPAYDIDPCGVTYVIVKMLDPDPRQRAQLPQVIKHFSPHSAQDYVDYNTVTTLFDSLARKGKVQRTVNQLRQVLQYNIDSTRSVPEPVLSNVGP